MITTKIVSSFLLVLLSQCLWAFELNLTSTNENCPGNGSISISISNANPEGSMSFVVFKLPNTTTPYATPAVPIVNGLTAGEYVVVATQTIDNTSSSEQSSITIFDTFTPLEYTVNYFNQSCSDTSTITVNVSEGLASSFEITAGPVTFPQQTTNVFLNVPEGTYTIRVFDSCGIASVTTITVFFSPSGFFIGSPSISNTTPASCDFAVISNTISPNTGTSIAYPLQVIYTIFPPDGSPSYTLNQTILAGDPLQTTIMETFPTFEDSSFTYTIAILDNCGVTVNQNFTVNFSQSVSVTINRLPCNSNYFTINTANLSPPYQITFDSFPNGFIPQNFNVNYPGPFSSNTIIFGDENNLVPIGNYSFTIQDACGRNQTISFSIQENIVLPNVGTGNNGCTTNTGFIRIAVPDNSIVATTVTVAPPSYPFPLPHDVSAQIIDGVIRLDPVPIGSYVITITDECDFLFQLNTIEVPVYTDKGLEYNERVGCDIGRSSVRIISKNGAITNIVITEAPSLFAQSLPFEASSFVAASVGAFYMNELPPGQYTFEVIDVCGFTNTITVLLNEYLVTNSSFNPIFNCGSFDINLNFESNGTNGQSFWLQKLINPETNAWGHPDTNVIYPVNSTPNATNGIALANNTINYNFVFNGEFRIIRKFNSYNNGNEITSIGSATKVCLEIFNPSFLFSEALEIIEINNSSCSTNGLLDVIVNAIGNAPLQYKLILMDGQMINIDNGTSPIFYNLPLGLYTLQVEDACGNIKTKIFQVDNLRSLINSNDPINLTSCVNSITNNERFNLTEQFPMMFSPENLSEYTISFHTSLSEAQQNLNQILNTTNFNPSTNPQTIFIRIVNNLIPQCYEIKDFLISVGQTPFIDLNQQYITCNGGPLTVTINNPLPDTTYHWPDGATSTSFSTSTIGSSTVSVFATTTYYNPTFTCTTEKEITISISVPPNIESITTVDWTQNENSITVNANNNGFHTYSIDGIHYQAENTFTNLTPGVYTVYVQDTIGCGIVSQDVWLLYYPKFFTPNGDGFNDRWFIENSNLEENFIIHIFDRYGKLITIFNSKNEGWDGNLNGYPLFSSDYWFMIYRNDGRVHRGHFSLKR